MNILGFGENKVSVSVEPQFLPHSAGKREETEEILRKLYFKDVRKTFCIDGTASSSNIVMIDDDDYEKEFSTLLFPKGIDGVILNTTKKCRLILPVADCASICVYHKSGEIYGSFHAGYKGVAGEEASDLGIITTMVEGLKVVANTNDLSEFEFYIGPMIGRKFELPKSYVEPIFSRILKEYNLKQEKYFLKHDTDNTKIYLHLRMLIRDILEKLGKKIRLKYHSVNDLSFFDNGITDKWSSEYPSHRLFTQYQGNYDEIKKIYTELNNYNLYLQDVLEKKSQIKQINRRMKSKKFELYTKDYRLATILEN